LAEQNLVEKGDLGHPKKLSLQCMSFIKSLNKITGTDAVRVGGKVYNCARLKQAGFPVPDGIAVMANARESSEVFSELQDWLNRQPENALFAVRSSATDEDSAGHSFAGIHETKLNVTHTGVADAIRECWASVVSPQALSYRHTQGLPTRDIQAGVLVQEMIQPITSGVAFTMNPVTGVRDEIVINASWGLGEVVVGGHVEPDEFRIRKTEGTILSSHIGTKRFRVVSEHGHSRLLETDMHERTKPSLMEDQLKELLLVLIRIEQFFNSPQDIEWCYDGKQFWILQSRPVTVSISSKPDIEWTRANARDVLPDLTSPQALSSICEGIKLAMNQFYGKLLVPEEELGPILKTFYGRMYFNISQIRHVCRVTGIPPALFLRGLGYRSNIKAADESPQFPPLIKLLRALPDVMRLSWMGMNVSRLMKRYEGLLRQEMTSLTLQDPNKLSDPVLFSVFKEWIDVFPKYMQMALLLGSVMIYERPLKKVCQRVGFPYEQLVHTHLATGEKSVSTQQAFDLLGLANLARSEEKAKKYFTLSLESFGNYREALSGTNFLKEFDIFLQKYGHRGNYESDYSLPRYSEDPTPLLFAIRTHVQTPDCPTPEKIITRQNSDAAAAWAAFTSNMNWWQRLTLILRVRSLLKKMKQMYLWREDYRSKMAAIAAVFRQWHLILADRFVERGWIQKRNDYFFLRTKEILAGWEENSQTVKYQSIINQRKAELASWRNIEMPLLMRESELPALIRRSTAPLPDTELTELHGLCVSAGYAEGEVVVIREPTEFALMKTGAILVAPATDPSWTPLFTLASGVIVEVGGTISHAFTVAREYGLPALANIENATKLLKNGDHVRLDATNGRVHMLSRVTKRT
jgi:phosphohistidine swiveling domain-containing protein